MLFPLIFNVCEVTKPVSGTTYYINAKQGNDSNDGTTKKHPWQSIARVNRARLQSGDRVLFAAGQTYVGNLQLRKSGSDGAEGDGVEISTYGQGNARIYGDSGDGIALQDCVGIKIRKLEILGCGRKEGSDGAGVRLVRTRGVTLDRLEIRGFRVAGISASGDADLRITRTRVLENGGAGIEVSGGYEDVPRARNIYIGDCVAENNPGDPKNLDNHSGNGIVVGGADGVLIEYCAASNNGWDMPRDGNGPVGIWGWNCDRLTIQHCISHDNKSPGADGGGFDFDGGVTNSVLQYNLSYNNQGCGYLLCQYPGAALWKNNVVRFNISYNDGSKNLQCGIGLWLGDKDISDAQIYNNTIVNRKYAVHSLGSLPGFIYRDNIFVAGEELLVGRFDAARFEGNLYWTTGKSGSAFWRDEKEAIPTIDAWMKATGQETSDGTSLYRFADPLLELPGEGNGLPTDPRKLARMRFFRLRTDSPAVGAARGGFDRGSRDFFGWKLPKGKPVTMGAHAMNDR